MGTLTLFSSDLFRLPVGENVSDDVCASGGQNGVGAEEEASPYRDDSVRAEGRAAEGRLHQVLVEHRQSSAGLTAPDGYH